MRKLYALSIILSMMILCSTGAKAKVSSMAELFGKYKFTATVEVTEAGKAFQEYFAAESEVIITKDAANIYDAQITGFAGAKGSEAIKVNAFSEEKQMFKVNNPSGNNYGAFGNGIYYSEADGKYPFGDVALGALYFTISEDAQTITVPDFTLVGNCNFDNSTCDVLAKFTNVKMVLVEAEKIDIADITGEWTAKAGAGAYDTNDQSPITKSHWGFGTIIGSRFYPTNGISLLALYRYYSPYFDNALGYAFSETSRLGDENGGYLGFDITRLRNWRFIGYGDIFYFSGYKYGLGDATRTLGYDAMAEIQYSWSKHPSFQGGDGGRLSLRLRARQKGDATYSTRAQFDWAQGSWSLRTTAEANIIPSKLSTLNSQLTYGFTIFQDISYSLPLREGRGLGFRLRLQGFDAREWANRIYTYEHDVLYAYSIPAVYGLGGRAYLCLRWQIIPQLALYFRASETVYARKWAAAHSRPLTRTDLHLLLRATF